MVAIFVCHSYKMPVLLFLNQKFHNSYVIRSPQSSITASFHFNETSRTLFFETNDINRSIEELSTSRSRNANTIWAIVRAIIFWRWQLGNSILCVFTYEPASFSEQLGLKNNTQASQQQHAQQLNNSSQGNHRHLVCYCVFQFLHTFLLVHYFLQVLSQ